MGPYRGSITSTAPWLARIGSPRWDDWLSSSAATRSARAARRSPPRRPRRGRRSSSATAPTAPSSSPTRSTMRRTCGRWLEQGCDRVLGIGSVGSLKPGELEVGALVCPDDFIALGLGDSIFGDERAHSAPGFAPRWREEVIAAWSEGGQAPRDGGVYWQARGPRFETPAEIRLMAAHADVVGMTIASECVVARRARPRLRRALRRRQPRQRPRRGDGQHGGDGSRPADQRRAPARGAGGGPAAPRGGGPMKSVVPLSCYLRTKEPRDDVGGDGRR